MSLASFAITIACMITIVAYSPSRKTYFITAFLTTIALMQLVDALIWLSIRRNSQTLNRFASIYLIPAVLSAQLIVSYYGIKYLFGWSNIYYEIALWITVIIICTKWVHDCLRDGPLTNTNEDGYLVWCQTKYTHIGKLMFLVALLLPILVGFPNGYIKVAVVLVPTVTFALNYTNSAFGSRWCWTSNIMALIVTAAVFMSKKH